MVKIIEMLAPKKENGARSGLPLLGCIGVTIHNTDNWSKGAGAKNHGAYLQGGGSNVQASWHYAVDDTCVTHSIPDNETAWHAGDGGNGNGNRKTVAIEICVNPDSDLTKATDNAAWLAAKILKSKGLPATALYQHHDWSGKNCPSQIRASKPYGWDTFKSKVKAYYNGENVAPVPKPKRHEDPNGVLYPGDTVCFNTVFTVDYIDVPNNRVCSKKMIGGKPTANYHWVDAGPCTEVNSKGSKAGDQVLYVGEHFRVDGDYKVLAIDIPTEAAQLKVGKTTVWVKSAYLSKVTYK